MTYTLVVASAMLLAKGRARGWAASPGWRWCFILLSSLKGYFTQFSANGDALQLLNDWSKGHVQHDDFGGYFYKEIQVPGKNGTMVSELGKFPWVSARVYSLNLLTELPRLKSQLYNPPTVVCD